MRLCENISLSGVSALVSNTKCVKRVRNEASFVPSLNRRHENHSLHTESKSHKTGFVYRGSLLGGSLILPTLSDCAAVLSRWWD